MLSIADVSRLGRKRQPNKTAISMGSDSLTYAEFNTLVNQVANNLIERGVKHGDRVAIFANNCLNYAVVSHAIAKCAAISVPINFRFRGRELSYVINQTKPLVLFVESDLFSLVEQSQTDFECLPLMLSLEDIPSARAEEPNRPVDPQSPAMIMFTSGTTGFPKGVLFSHASFLAVAYCHIIEGDLTNDDRVMISLPLFHNAGLNALLLPTLMVGASAIITRRGFDPDEIFGTIEKSRISLTMLVPTMLAMLVNYPNNNKFDLSSLKKVWYGSSPISPTVYEASRKLFNAGFYQFFGQTETGMNSILRPEDHKEYSQCTGREMISAELRIVDEDSADVSIGGIGEIQSAQHPLGMIGYYQNQHATDEVIVDGWIKTGDLARVEECGFFTIVGRKKEVIISGAENIYPKEVEDALLAHPAIREAAVFGIPDEIYGESVCAAIALKASAKVSEQEIVAHCENRIARYKKPKRIEFHDELPKNASGKIAKTLLRAPYWENRDKEI